MNTVKLQNLRDDVEKMDSIHQKHIFDIVRRNKINFTHNNNGIFINLTTVDNKTLNEIKSYILYVNLQQEQLEKGEKDKENYVNQFYNGNKDIVESDN
tara:strand:+ start:13638 stop:13931 length:294 start_codon:yes stop_codon:yes gene_type:complete